MNQKHVELFNVVLPDLDSHAFSYCSSLPHHKSLLAASCYTSFFGSCHPSVMSMFAGLLLLMDGVFPSNDDTTLCATVNVTSRIQTQSHSSSRLTGCPNNHVKTYGDRDGNPLLDNGTPLPMATVASTDGMLSSPRGYYKTSREEQVEPTFAKVIMTM